MTASIRSRGRWRRGSDTKASTRSRGRWRRGSDTKASTRSRGSWRRGSDTKASTRSNGGLSINSLKGYPSAVFILLTVQFILILKK